MRVYRFPKSFLGLYITEKGNKLEAFTVTTAHKSIEQCWTYFNRQVKSQSSFNIPLLMRYSKYLRFDYPITEHSQISYISLCISQGGVLKYAKFKEQEGNAAFGALEAFCALLKDIQVTKVQRLLTTSTMKSNVIANILLGALDEFRNRKILLQKVIDENGIPKI